MSRLPSEHWWWRRFAAFDVLTEDARTALMAECRLVRMRPGQQIYGVGDRSAHVYLLGMGVVRVTAAGERERPRALLYAGEIFGEAALFGAPRRDHGADVGQEAMIGEIPAAFLRELMQRDAMVAGCVGRLLAARLEVMEARLAELRHSEARARVAQVLITMERRFGTAVGGEVLVPVRLRQQDVADLAAIRRETVNAILRDFAERRIAVVAPAGIRIPRPAALHAIVREAGPPATSATVAGPSGSSRG